MRATDPRCPKSSLRVAVAHLLCGILTVAVPFIIYLLRDYPPLEYWLRLTLLLATFREGNEFAPILIGGTALLVGAAFLFWLGAVFCHLPFVMIRADGTMTRAGHRLSSLKGILQSLAAFGAFFGLVFALICALAIGEQAEKHLSLADAKAEFPKFKEAISAALGSDAESLGAPLHYPRNSLVVYAVRGKGGALDDQGYVRYYYGCPGEWLAVTKEGVRLVVLVSFDSFEVIGRYSSSGAPAYKGNWKVEFVDLYSRHIVARKIVSVRDPDTLPNVSAPFAGDSHSWPGEGEVVSTIRGTVSFGSAHK